MSLCQFRDKSENLCRSRENRLIDVLTGQVSDRTQVLETIARARYSAWRSQECKDADGLF